MEPERIKFLKKLLQLTTEKLGLLSQEYDQVCYFTSVK